MTLTSVEGKHRCGSCLQWVGTNYDGETRPYQVVRLAVSGDVRFCADRAACERRWQAVREAERFAAAEARIYDPEPDDENDEP